jgi:hypothetical protein
MLFLSYEQSKNTSRSANRIAASRTGHIHRQRRFDTRGKEREAFQELAKALSRMDEQDRKLLVSMAEGMARRGAKR